MDSNDLRRRRGYSNWRLGLEAEDSVTRDYRARGARHIVSRWRSGSGEIDLILADGPTLVFVEVKRSRDFATAAEQLGGRQVERILAAAEDYMEGEPGGTLTDCRFDLALVDGTGRTRVIENALLA